MGIMCTGKNSRGSEMMGTRKGREKRGQSIRTQTQSMLTREIRLCVWDRGHITCHFIEVARLAVPCAEFTARKSRRERATEESRHRKKTDRREARTEHKHTVTEYAQARERKRCWSI